MMGKGRKGHKRPKGRGEGKGGRDARDPRGEGREREEAGGTPAIPGIKGLYIKMLRDPYEWYYVVASIGRSGYTYLDPVRFFNYMLMSMREKDFYVLGAFEREKGHKDIRDEKDGRKEEEAGETPAIPGREVGQDARPTLKKGETEAIPGREMIGCAVVHGEPYAAEKHLQIDYMFEEEGTRAKAAMLNYIDILATAAGYGKIYHLINVPADTAHTKNGYESRQVIMVKPLEPPKKREAPKKERAARRSGNDGI